MPYFAQYTEAVSDALLNMTVTIDTGEEKSADEGLTAWCALTGKVKAKNATMYFAGNGASAMMASHMAADASKNGGFRSQAFNDAALMTAIGNDISYDEVFALPLRRFADSGDVLVTISSSGNSPNIIRAIETARPLGLTVVTVSGMGPDNRSRRLGDLNFYVPAATYGIAEASHQVLLHAWLDRFMETENRSS